MPRLASQGRLIAGGLGIATSNCEASKLIAASRQLPLPSWKNTELLSVVVLTTVCFL